MGVSDSLHSANLRRIAIALVQSHHSRIFFPNVGPDYSSFDRTEVRDLALIMVLRSKTGRSGSGSSII